MRITRRTALQGVIGAGIGAGIGPLATPALAANKPLRIGLLTVLTGPLAEGGIQIRASAAAMRFSCPAGGLKPRSRAAGRRRRRA